MKIGILAVQGDFKEHETVLKVLDVEPVYVKLPADLETIQGLIIPGGESTTMGKFMQETGLGAAIQKKAANGFPIYGTCAGAILLAYSIENYPDQYSLRLIDISIDRNAYGRQTDSFSDTVIFQNKRIHGAFIRAPRITRIGASVQVLATHDVEPVLVRQGNILAGTFHPELTGERKIHEYFIGMTKQHG